MGNTGTAILTPGRSPGCRDFDEGGDNSCISDSLVSSFSRSLQISSIAGSFDGIVLRFRRRRLLVSNAAGILGNFPMTLSDMNLLLLCRGVGEIERTSICGSTISFVSVTSLFSLVLGDSFDDSVMGDDDNNNEDCQSEFFGGDPRVESSLVPMVSIVANDCVGDTAAAPADVHIGLTGRAWAYGSRWYPVVGARR